MSDLSLVGFACRDDADDVVPGCVDHHEQAMLNLAYQLVAIFAVAVPSVGLDQTVRVEESSGRVGEVKPALGKARVALGFISFEIHGAIVVHWPTFFKLGGVR